MKYIKKTGAPKPLREWIRANKSLHDAQFGSHGFPTSEVRQALLSEQGGLCAYTMAPIGGDTCHIEHIKPQALSRAEGALHETWTYTNLLACYPGDDPKASGRDEIGATKKANTWDEKLFVTPLQGACESRFKFSADGKVAIAKPNDVAVEWTIKTLGLQSGILDEWRKGAIEAFGVSLVSPFALKRSEAEQLRVALRNRNADGAFSSYCVALEQVATQYIGTLEKIAKKKKYAAKPRSTKRK